MQDTPDHELLAAYRDGDREAFAVLVARHQGLIRTACLRQAPAGETEDCIQAVFLVLARRPASATRAPALVAWLLRVSWYVCRRAQRGTRRRRQAEGEAAQASGRHGSIRPEALDHLDDCLAKLPERQRVAVSLHYLAERPAEEVAAALGVNRDNAYQLVSRGLATLRSLLAQRGIALSGPTLLALLSGEAHAATASAGATTSIALSLSATPSAVAAKLATGVTTAMTLAAPSTITMIAASLLLAAGVTTAVVTAEPAQIPTAGPVQPVKAPVPVPTEMDKILDQTITMDFQDTDLVDVIGFLARVSTLKALIIDPQVAAAAPPPVTLRVEKMQLRRVLEFIEKVTGTTHAIWNEAYVIQPAGAPKPMPSLDLSAADARLRKRLGQRVTFEFQDQSHSDVLAFLRQVTEANIVMSPAGSSDSSTVTLRVREITLQDAMQLVGLVSNTTLRYVDQALVFEAATAKGSIPVRTAAPSVPPQPGPLILDKRVTVAAVRDGANNQPELVMLAIPKDGGMKEGQEFIIYRENKYICKVRVEKIMNDMAATRIIPESWNTNGLTIQQGDHVATRM